jgi:hypothetical protein
LNAFRAASRIQRPDERQVDFYCRTHHQIPKTKPLYEGLELYQWHDTKLSLLELDVKPLKATKPTPRK